MATVSQKLGIRAKEDWYRVSLAQFDSIMYGRALLRIYRNDIGRLLQAAFPDEQWDLQQFKSKDKRAAQRYLFVQVSRLFPHLEVIEEHIHTDAERLSGRSIELDIFIPSLQLAFEYQGRHHYVDVPAFAPLEMHQQRDEEKQALCEAAGIQLISIPFTWDNTIDTLKRDFIPQEYLRTS